EAVILHALDKVEVESLPQNLPAQIEVPLDGLTEVDAAIHVRDLKLPAGVTVLTDPDELITKALASTVQDEERAVVEEAAAAAEAEAPAEAGAEPEAEAEATEP